ncbi:MAG: hypothetical protein Q9159_005007 [Coniocarpon cinnabarinum]
MEGNDSKTIAERAQVCLDLFSEILKGTGNLSTSERLKDILGRFHVWIHASDNGALQTGSSSLESRWAAAPNLVKEANQLLSELEETLRYIIDPDRDSKEGDPENADPEEADVDGDENEILSNLLDTMSITITHLFKTSTSYRDTPKRDP